MPTPENQCKKFVFFWNKNIEVNIVKSEKKLLEIFDRILRLEFIKNKKNCITEVNSLIRSSDKAPILDSTGARFLTILCTSATTKICSSKNIDSSKPLVSTELVIGTIYRPVIKKQEANYFKKKTQLCFFRNFEKNKVVFIRGSVTRANRRTVSLLNQIYKKRFSWNIFSKFDKKKSNGKIQFQKPNFFIGFRPDIIWSYFKNKI